MFAGSPLRTRFALRRMSLRPGLTGEQRGVISAALQQNDDVTAQVGQTFDDAAETATTSPTPGPFIQAMQKLLANLPAVIELIEALLQELGVLPAPAPNPTPTAAMSHLSFSDADGDQWVTTEEMAGIKQILRERFGSSLPAAS